MTMHHAAGDSWAAAQSEAAKAAADLSAGDYWHLWDDGEAPLEPVTDELRRALRPRGLRLDTDCDGIRVVAVEAAG